MAETTEEAVKRHERWLFEQEEAFNRHRSWLEQLDDVWTGPRNVWTGWNACSTGGCDAWEHWKNKSVELAKCSNAILGTVAEWQGVIDFRFWISDFGLRTVVGRG